ncbi:MAG TPA: (Fe-S)-binding protein [Dehalococcoidia bacterium]|nr:(Fe-S)-binding protein [Dehalococcoidia bacterium]
MDIPELKKFDAEIEPWVCTQCGNCRTVCPVFEQIGWESASPRGKIYYIKELLKQRPSKQNPIDDDFVKRIFQCTLCIRCQEVCQTKIDMMRVWQAVRAELGNRGLWPKEIQGIRQATLSQHNLYSMPNSRRTVWAMMIEDQVLPKINKVAEVAYFVGCVAAFTGRISRLPESTVAILDSAGVDYTILGPDEWCCGNPLFFVGGHSAAVEIAQHNLEKLRQLKIKKLITNCAGCYRAFKNEYPRLLGEDIGIEVLHFSQFLSQLIDEGKLKFNRPKEITITYHDPCEIGRHCGIYDEPRYVLGSLPGVKLIEMPNNRSNSECCGGGGLLKATEPDMSLDIAARRINQAIRSGATAIVSACVTCRLQLSEAVREKELNIDIYDISEFVAQFL